MSAKCLQNSNLYEEFLWTLKISIFSESLLSVSVVVYGKFVGRVMTSSDRWLKPGQNLIVGLAQFHNLTPKTKIISIFWLVLSNSHFFIMLAKSCHKKRKTK